MKSKIYRCLHEDAVLIRTKVFMEEQGFKEEFDDIDPVGTHLVLYDGAVPAACCRIFRSGDKCYSIGRIAVLREYRGQGIGRIIVQKAEQHIREAGGAKIILSAQVRVKGFYQGLGYHCEGEVYMDEECPHIKMEKSIVNIYKA